MKNTPLTFFPVGRSRWQSMRFVYLVSMVATFLFFGSPAQAAVTLQIADGKLIGASGVIVNNKAYDVQFKDGACVSLFSGCDQTSDFVFQDHVSAVLASNALLDQVLLDSALGFFDSNPSLTNGCTNVNACSMWTPFFYTNRLGYKSSASQNFKPGYSSSDSVSQYASNWELTWDTTTVGNSTFALWSPSVASFVPEPETYAMIMVGLALVGVSTRRRKAEQTA